MKRDYNREKALDLAKHWTIGIAISLHFMADIVICRTKRNQILGFFSTFFFLIMGNVCHPFRSKLCPCSFFIVYLRIKLGRQSFDFCQELMNALPVKSSFVAI